jgi:hypothetical protein
MRYSNTNQEEGTEMPRRINRWIQHQKDRIRLDRKSFLIYSVLRILVILTGIRCFLQGRYEDVALCILSLVLFLLPSFFSEKLKIEIPTLFESLIYLFIFAAEILGEVNHYYTAIPGWDTMLHTINGFLCAAIGFSLVDILNRKSKNLNLSPLYLAIVAFCFSMTVGVLWEFFEFFCDQTFFLDMQKDFIVKTIASVTLDPTHQQIPVKISNITKTVIYSADGTTTTINGGYLDIGIIDTMKDLFVNFIGAVVFSVIGYLYVKKRDSRSIAKSLILTTLTDEELAEQERQIERNNLEQINEAARREAAVHAELERRQKDLADDAERVKKEWKEDIEEDFGYPERKADREQRALEKEKRKQKTESGRKYDR